jgi:general secretion pathway protein I
MRRARTFNRGFTLIEVLVAFLILAFSLGALMSLFSGSLRSVRLGEDYAHATALARAQLVLFDAAEPRGPGVETGETEDGFRWTVESVEMPDMGPADADSRFFPLEVNVIVSWGALYNRSVSLSTFRLVRR